MWAKGYRNFRHANQETNSAIEAYHCFLKTKFLCDRRRKGLRRMDWLIYTLLKRVELYYWNMSRLKKYGFINNYRLEHIIETSIEKAKHIPDDHCVPHDEIQNYYWVQSQSSLKKYLVVYSNQTFSSCDCPWAMRGNICKHVIKVSMLQGYGSTEIHQLARSEVNVDVANGGSPIMGPDDDIVEDQNIEIASNENFDPIINELDECDLGRCQEIFDRCNKKIQAVMVQPPHSISRALLMEELVDKFVADMDQRCIHNFDFSYNDNERTLKRRKSFLSPKKRSHQRQNKRALFPDLNVDAQAFESFNFPLTGRQRLRQSMNTMPIQGHHDASPSAFNVDPTKYKFPVVEGGRLKKKTLEEELEAMYANKNSSTVISGITSNTF